LKLQSILFSVFVGVASTGCATVTVESVYNDSGAATASFDLQCPADQIQMTVLKRNDGLGCLGSKIGVQGCGKQTTYMCNNSRAWVRESEVQTLTPPATTGAAAPEGTAPAAP
jgi:hypothetical protein